MKFADHLAKVEREMQALDHEKRLVARERQMVEETQAKLQGRERDLRDRERMSILFISHDLAVVAELCDRVAIMRRGSIVEQGPASQVITAPVSPYTAELLASVPRLAAGAGQ